MSVIIRLGPSVGYGGLNHHAEADLGGGGEGLRGLQPPPPLTPTHLELPTSFEITSSECSVGQHLSLRESLFAILGMVKYSF